MRASVSFLPCRFIQDEPYQGQSKGAKCLGTVQGRRHELKCVCVWGGVPNFQSVSSVPR